jgi:hypothetical protein
VFSSVPLVLALVLGEVLARACGFGDPDAFGGSRLKAQWIFPPIFRTTADRSGYRPTDVRLVDRFFPRADGRTQRIFVFGESAVAGLGFSENASFPRALERRIRTAGGVDAVVVNCGISQISARQVHFVERQVLELRRRESPRPTRDVFVFYVGNNEFIPIAAERYRVHYHGNLPFTLRLDRLVESSRLYEGLKNLSRTGHEWLTPTLRPMDLQSEELPNPPKLTDEDTAHAVSHHAEELRAMVEEARAQGAIPVLATVVTNMEWDAREAPREGWVGDAIGSALPDDPGDRRTKLEEAERHATADLATGDENPFHRWRAHLRRANVRRAAGNGAGARDDFLAAYADDPYRLRCLPEMNANVRRLAGELGVPLADCDAHMAALSPDRIVGYDMVYDCVHLTIRANERVAEAVHQTLAAASLVPALADGESSSKDRESERATTATDSLLVWDWLGWNDNPSLIANRDCKKLLRLREQLDEKIGRAVATPEELVWAADGYALEVGGEERARSLYERAAAQKPTLRPIVEANLRWLDARPK